MTEELVALVRKYAVEIQNGRTLVDIVDHMKGEIGELEDEIKKLALGEDAGDDGVAGEAIDIATCAIDFMVVHDPEVSDAEWAGKIDGIVWMTDERLKRFGTRGLGNVGQMILATNDLQEIADVEGKNGLKRDLTSLIVAECLMLVRSDASQMSSQDILDLATTKLEKWKTHYSDSIHRVR